MRCQQLPATGKWCRSHHWDEHTHVRGFCGGTLLTGRKTHHVSGFCGGLRAQALDPLGGAHPHKQTECILTGKIRLDDDVLR